MIQWTLVGFLLVLGTQSRSSEGASTPIQANTEVNHPNGQVQPREPEVMVIPATVPVVSPPSLKEVQQAVQEASEQVEEGRGAEEVLKGLLERVVEAALGQSEVALDAKEAVQEAAEQTEESPTEVEDKSEKPVKSENNGEDKENAGSVEKQEAVKEDVFKDVTAKGPEVVKTESEAAASLVKSSESVEIKDSEVIIESLGKEFSQAALEVSEETNVDFDGKEIKVEGSLESDVLPHESNFAETETKDAEKTEEVAVDGKPGEGTLDVSKTSLEVTDEEQIANDLEKDVTRSQREENNDETIALPSNDFKIATTQTVAGESLDEEEGDRIEEFTVEEQAHLGIGETDEKVRGAADSEKDKGEALISEHNEETEEEMDDTHGSVEETQEIPMIFGPQPEDATEALLEQDTKSKLATQEPSTQGLETQENSPGDDQSDPGNKRIIAPQSSLANGVLVEHNELGDIKADGLVEDSTGTKETNRSEVEPWKIGAIVAAVLLVLETILVFVYIRKCTNPKRSPAAQRTCAEAAVEPEAATGGDDATLPAGNGDTQQISLLDEAKAKDEQAISMSALSGSATPELSDLQEDFSRDLRTSV